MADTLEIFGTEYTNVTGFKAENDLGDTLIYTKGSGGIDIPVFTVTSNPSGAYQTIACNKTFFECWALVEQHYDASEGRYGNVLPAVLKIYFSYDSTYFYTTGLIGWTDSIDGMGAVIYTRSDNPEHSILYRSDGELIDFDVTNY